MSAAALTAVPAAGRDARPGLGRLTLVELRKMTDTRAGFWLQLAIVALTVITVVALMLTGEDEDKTFEVALSLAIQPASILGPVVGVLLVSSEWSQRTAQITFGSFRAAGACWRRSCSPASSGASSRSPRASPWRRSPSRSAAFPGRSTSRPASCSRTCSTSPSR
jgi:hypothetical protein